MTKLGEVLSSAELSLPVNRAGDVGSGPVDDPESAAELGSLMDALPELIRELTEATDRAARAETRVDFLQEQLEDLQARLAELEAEGQPQLAEVDSAPEATSSAETGAAGAHDPPGKSPTEEFVALALDDLSGSGAPTEEVVDSDDKGEPDLTQGVAASAAQRSEDDFAESPWAQENVPVRDKEDFVEATEWEPAEEAAAEHVEQPADADGGELFEVSGEPSEQPVGPASEQEARADEELRRAIDTLTNASEQDEPSPAAAGQSPSGGPELSVVPEAPLSVDDEADEERALHDLIRREPADAEGALSEGPSAAHRTAEVDAAEGAGPPADDGDTPPSETTGSGKEPLGLPRNALRAAPSPSEESRADSEIVVDSKGQADTAAGDQGSRRARRRRKRRRR